MAQATRPHERAPAPTGVLALRVAGAALGWAALYAANDRVWTWGAEFLGLDLAHPLVGAAHFFVYDSVKVLLLLVGMVFAIGMLRTGIRPETVRARVQGKPLPVDLVLAALFGAVTPFCSCSSIPLFIGFVAAGVPLSVTLTFLLASPLVNEVAVVMLSQSFGWGITLIYVGSGLGLAILLGALFSRLDLEGQVADFVRDTPTARLHALAGRPSLA